MKNKLPLDTETVEINHNGKRITVPLLKNFIFKKDTQMSYSLVTPCNNYPSSTPEGNGDCIHKDKCTDRHVLQGALTAIHQMPFGVGHLGGGEIKLTCFNKKVEEKVDTLVQTVNQQVVLDALN